MESIYSRCKWEYKVRGGKISTWGYLGIEI
jgi:hypothetical protein